MPVHSILIWSNQTKAINTIVFAKYYNKYSRDEQEEFESTLLSNADVYLARNIESLFCFTIRNDIHVVFQRFGQLIIFVSGCDEMDEIMLADVVNCIRNIILTLLSHRGVGDVETNKAADTSILGEKGTSDGTSLKSGYPSEHDILNPMVYGMLTLAIDELVAGPGILDSMDVESLLLAAKMKV